MRWLDCGSEYVREAYEVSAMQKNDEQTAGSMLLVRDDWSDDVSIGSAIEN